ncbi:MAG: sodium:solute symporter family protein [Candidatus Dadabacteria bacterium]|nr:MAG: sodium:solute symporter family protein [Candidatus Dadabacteria bacterium]
MTTIIISVVVIYCALSIWFGVLTNRLSKDTSEDYFLASRSVSWFHLALTIFATWFSTFAFLGAPGFAYKMGASWFAMQGVFGVGSALLLWFIGRKLWLAAKKRDYITPGDLLADFYGTNALKIIVGVLSVLALVPYCLIQLIGIGKAMTVATHGEVDYYQAVLFASTVTAFYIFSGGLRAIIWTDILQGILFTLVLIVAAAVAINVSGGIESGFKVSLSTSPHLFVLSPSKIGAPISMMIIWSLGFILLPHLWQRSYMAKSAETIGKAIVVHTVLSFIVIVATVVIGTLAAGFMPGITETDKLVPFMFARYAPYALPLLVLAAFASGMSTIDSQLLTASSVIIRDLVEPLRKKQLKSSTERIVGKVVVVSLIGLLTVLALLPEMQGPIVELASKGVSIALLFLAPLIGPLAWKGATKEGAFWGLLIGVLVLFLFEFKIISISLPFSFYPAPFALLIELALFFIISIMTKKS